MPSLNNIYLVDVVPIETRWNIFKWIMSFSDGAVTKIGKLKNEFRLICATLYALVKVFNHYIFQKILQIIDYKILIRTIKSM